jgi:3-phosphoshikimate 1-carboxyvinyltransferase
VITVTKKDQSLFGKINLPASKSISNRVLILRELIPSPFNIIHLSEADDTVLMKDLLEMTRKTEKQNITTELNCNNAGTVFRFLTAYLAQKPGNWHLTGSVRMKDRPIKILVDALRELGAEIQYTKKKGFPPLFISGKNLVGGKIDIDSQVSSQYISALLMIAPVIKEGIEIILRGQIASAPYLRMTLGLLNYFGINYSRSERKIIIERQDFLPHDITIEPDWSAAAFWYEMVALSEKGEILLKELKPSMLQGDSILTEIFKSFGVQTRIEKDGVRLIQSGKTVHHFEFDFTDHPDLAQPIIATCAGLNIPGVFKGIESLRIKETDRIEGLMNELQKLGVNLTLSSESELKLSKSKINFQPNKSIQTYGDHRMAMSFAPLALKKGSIQIENPEVVTKSYPRFWQDIERVGFTLNNGDQ